MARLARARGWPQRPLWKSGYPKRLRALPAVHSMVGPGPADSMVEPGHTAEPQRTTTHARSSRNVHVVNKLFKGTPTRNRARQNLEIGIPEAIACTEVRPSIAWWSPGPPIACGARADSGTTADHYPCTIEQKCSCVYTRLANKYSAVCHARGPLCNLHSGRRGLRLSEAPSPPPGELLGSSLPSF